MKIYGTEIYIIHSINKLTMNCNCTSQGGMHRTILRDGVAQPGGGNCT